MIDKKALDKVILDHYEDQLLKEIRDSIVYGSKDASQIYAKYMKEVERKKRARSALIWSMSMALLCLSIILFPFLFTIAASSK